MIEIELKLIIFKEIGEMVLDGIFKEVCNEDIPCGKNGGVVKEKVLTVDI